MAYATLEELKQALNIRSTTYDQELNALLEAATDLIDAWTRSTFVAVNDTRYFDYQTSTRLWLDFPLHDLVSITNGDGTIIFPSDVVLYPLSGPPYAWIILKSTADTLFTASPAGAADIAVTGVWGHLDSSGNTPQPIRRACVIVASWLFNRRQHAGVERVAMPDASVMFSPDFPLEARIILDGYTWQYWR